MAAARALFKPLFDELIFTEVSFLNYTPEEKREMLKQCYEAAKEVGASIFVLETPLQHHISHPATDISAVNLGFYTGLPENPQKADEYYAFASDILSFAD